MEVFKIFGTLGLRDNEYRTGLSRAEQQGQRASGNINRGFQNTGSMFSNMGIAAGGFGASMLGMAGVTVGVGAAIAGTVSAGANFEKTMSTVKAMTGATGDQMEAMTKQAKDLGADTKFSASEAAEGMAFLGMAGFKTNDIMKAMPGMLNLAAAGQLDLGRAADIASNIMAGFSIDAGQAGHASDVLAFAASNSNTSVEQLGEAMKYASGTASTVGLGLEETTAAMMSMADVGLQGSVAGQAFATSLGRLAKPSKEAQKAIDGMNISFFDQQGKIKPLPSIIAELEKGMGGMTEQQKTATLQTIFGAEAFKNWAALLKTGSSTLEENTNKLKDSNGAAQTMADTMNDNLIGRWDSFTSKLEGLAITIFERVAPALVGLLTGAEAAVTGFDQFIQALIPLDSMMGGIVNITEALSLMWKTAGGDSEAGIQAVDLMTKLGLSPEMQEMAMSVIFNISNGIDLLKALVAGDWGAASNIAEKLGMSPETQAQIIGIAASIHGAISGLVSGVMSVVSAMAPVVMSIVGSIWSFIQGVFSIMAPYIQAAINGIASFTSEILGRIASFWEQNGTQISQAVSIAFNFIQSIISAVMPIIAFIIQGTWEGIKSVISGALDIIMGVIKVFSSALTGDWTGVWEGIKQILSGAWDLMWGIVDLGIGKVTELVTKFVPGLKGIFEPVRDFLAKPFELAWDAIKKVIDWIKEGWSTVSGIIDSVKGGASAVGDFVGGLVGRSAPAPQGVAPVNGFASGGIFKPNQERMIKIGDAKSYDEAVLPLNDGTLGKIGERIAGTMQGGGGGNYKIVIQPQPIILNGRQIAKAAGQEINRELGFQRGREVRV